MHALHVRSDVMHALHAFTARSYACLVVSALRRFRHVRQVNRRAKSREKRRKIVKRVLTLMKALEPVVEVVVKIDGAAKRGFPL